MKKVKNRELNLNFFESVVIQNLLTDSSYASLIINNLNPDYFNNEGNKLIVKYTTEFYNKRNCLPNITELKALIAGDGDLIAIKESLKEIKHLDKTYNRQELIENTEEFLKQKAVYDSITKIVDQFTAKNMNYASALSMFENACNIKIMQDNGLNYFDDSERIIDYLSTKQSKIKSGWNFIDQYLGGGFLEDGKSLGPTNVGKSIFLGNIASNLVASGKNVVLISLEMPEMLYATRITSHLSKIKMSDMEQQKNQLKVFFDVSKNQNYGKFVIKEFPPKSVTIGQIKTYLDNLKRSGFEIDALVIDYLGLIKPSGGENGYEQGKQIAEELRALSYHIEAPIVSAVQTNREGMENPSLDTISESIGVAFTADVVWGIYQDEDDREIGIIKVSNIKNRLGPKGNVTSMRVDYSTLSLSEEEKFLDNEKEGAYSRIEKQIENKLEKHLK